MSSCTLDPEKTKGLYKYRGYSMNITCIKSFAKTIFLTATLGVASSQLFAAEAISLDIKSDLAGPALMKLANAAHVQILVPENIAESITLSALSGEYSLEDALSNMLVNTGLSYKFTSERSIVINTLFKEEDSSFEGKKNVRENIEEVLVTASRREQNLQDVSMAITAVKPDDFTSVGLTRLTEVIAYTPGVSVRDSAEPGGAPIAVRGIGQDAVAITTPVVGIYMDAVPMSSNSPWGNGGSFGFDGLLGDIERVEFLQGPQGTLYGSTSIAGAIKYITRKPALDTFRTHASVDLSDTREGGLNQIYNGRFSVPLIKDKLGLTVAGFQEANGGFVDAVDGDGTLLTEDADSYDRYGVSADVYYVFSDRLNFRVRALSQKAEYTGLTQVNIDGATNELFYGSLVGFNGDLDRSLENTLYAGSLEYQFDGATLTASSSYTEELWTDNQQFPHLHDFADTLIGRPLGTTTFAGRSWLRGSERFTQEIQLASDSGGTWEWIVGLYYTNENTLYDIGITVQPGDVNWNTSVKPSEYKEYAAFGNLTYYVTSEFDLTIGARLSDHQMSFFPKTSSDLFPFVDPYINEVGNIVDTWSFAARYRPAEDLSLYARVASGYRPTSANSILSDGVVSLPEIVESDTLWSYEVGAKGWVADGILSYDLALWYLDWKDFQTFFSLAPFVEGLGNAYGGITAKGVEGSLTFKPVDSLSVIANITYSDSTLNEDEPHLNGLAGQQFPYVPKWMFSSRARYDFPLSSGMDGHVGVGVRYQNSSRSAFTDDEAFIPGVSDPAGGPYDPSYNVPTDAYVAVDLNAGIAWGRYSLSLYAKNLLNEKAMLGTDGVTAYPTASAVPLRPLTVGVVFSVDF